MNHYGPFSVSSKEKCSNTDCSGGSSMNLIPFIHIFTARPKPVWWVSNVVYTVLSQEGLFTPPELLAVLLIGIACCCYPLSSPTSDLWLTSCLPAPPESLQQIYFPTNECLMCIVFSVFFFFLVDPGLYLYPCWISYLIFLDRIVWVLLNGSSFSELGSWCHYSIFSVIFWFYKGAFDLFFQITL